MTNALAAKAGIAQSTHSRLEATHDRIETMLEQQQAALQKDHARVGLVLGATMVVTGMVLMIAGIPWTSRKLLRRRRAGAARCADARSRL